MDSAPLIIMQNQIRSRPTEWRYGSSEKRSIRAPGAPNRCTGPTHWSGFSEIKIPLFLVFLPLQKARWHLTDFPYRKKTSFFFIDTPRPRRKQTWNSHWVEFYCERRNQYNSVLLMHSFQLLRACNPLS